MAEQAARKMANYRRRLRARGLRPVQIWVTDLRDPAVRAPARRRCGHRARASQHGRRPRLRRRGAGRGRGLGGLRRGDLVLVALPGDCGKPRPAVVVQGDTLTAADSRQRPGVPADDGPDRDCELSGRGRALRGKRLAPQLGGDGREAGGGGAAAPARGDRQPRPRHDAGGRAGAAAGVGVCIGGAAEARRRAHSRRAVTAPIRGRP